MRESRSVEGKLATVALLLLPAISNLAACNLIKSILGEGIVRWEQVPQLTQRMEGEERNKRKKRFKYCTLRCGLNSLTALNVPLEREWGRPRADNAGEAEMARMAKFI